MAQVPKWLLSDVLKAITPSAAERKKVIGEVKAFTAALEKEFAKRKLKANVILGGSFAKDTWVSGDYDVDLFIAFDLKHKEQDLSGLLEPALKLWKPERLHGSRDYFWVRNSIRFEVVPVLAIKKPTDARNVTDFSPLHVAWVNKHGKKYKDDIMLAKKFCKAARVYGAESYIHGFSGHVLDALVIHHKGFLPFLRAVAKWQAKVVIDPKNAYKGKALLAMNASKIAGPLVLVDPVQPDRNAAAAVSQENFDKLVAAAKGFLTRPSKNAFEERALDLDALRKRGHLVLVEAKPLDGKEDVVGAKLTGIFDFIRKRLEKEGFRLKDAGWEWTPGEPAQLWYLCKEASLSKTMLWPGPPLRAGPHVEAFKKKYPNAYAKRGMLWATRRREWTAPEPLIEALLKDPYVRQRAVRARLKR